MSWRDGRQAVELGVLTDGLAGCAKCAIPPHLTHAEDILQCGLGAFLSVMCQNTNRQHKNIVPSEKRHGRIWDAYTKLALGIIISSVLVFISFVSYCLGTQKCVHLHVLV